MASQSAEKKQESTNPMTSQSAEKKQESTNPMTSQSAEKKQDINETNVTPQNSASLFNKIGSDPDSVEKQIDGHVQENKKAE